MNHRSRGLVSVIVTVKNGERYVASAVASLLSQSFQDFEVLVVDDGSTDRTLDILNVFRHPGLRVLSLPKSVGPFVAANRALALACGEFIARMDADDLSVPRRLEWQVALLRARPDVGLLGSSCHIIDGAGQRVGFAPAPYSDLAIRWQCLLRNPMHHSTVIMRRSVLDEHHVQYDGALRVGGDYELWPRLLSHTRALNQKAPVLEYRVWKGGITGSHRGRQKAVQQRVSLRTLRDVLPAFHVHPKDVADLRQLLVIHRHHAEAPTLSHRRRAELVALYLALFAEFCAKYHGEADLRALRTIVMKRAQELSP